MTFAPENGVAVYYHGGKKRQLIGHLSLTGRKIFFAYDDEFITTGLELSPFNLPLQTGIISSPDRTFDGLFRLFNDSLPDGWGRLLIDRKLMQAGINPGSLSPLDRLCLVGNGGMGALSYEPAHDEVRPLTTIDLDQIKYEVEATLNDDNQYVEELLMLGGSSAGARPKIMIQHENDAWLIKFKSSVDPDNICAIEYAYHLMAKAALLDIPVARIFPARSGGGFFGVKRFDRVLQQRVHMHSISGLLQADQREPSLDYETIMKITLYLTNSKEQCMIQFRNAVFNVLAHNRDDHAKNFSFLMDSNGIWRVSPAYDLTFSSGFAGEHTTTIMGEGKHPGRKHLQKLAAVVGIARRDAERIIDEVRAAVQDWQQFAAIAGVSKLHTANISSVLNSIRLDQ